MCRVAKIGEAKPDIEVPGLKTTINVELRKSKIKENIENALREFEKVVVCSDKRKILEMFKDEIKDERVLFCLGWEVPSLF